MLIPSLLLASLLTPETTLAIETADHMNVLGSEFTTMVAAVVGGIFLLLGAARAVIDNVVE